MALLYVQFYFITIATILGTGILGLPVTLAKSGFWPFVFPFIATYAAQVVQVVIFTELLLLAYHYKIQDKGTDAHLVESVPLWETKLDEDTSDEDDRIMKTQLEQTPAAVNPNLHMLGSLFLHPIGCLLFDCVVGLGFLAILVSYALAGPQAVAEAAGAGVGQVRAGFCLVLTGVVVFMQMAVQPVITLLTFLKGSMLCACVFITFLVGSLVQHDNSNSWADTGEPFLMGTVALGGIVSIMPILFVRINPVPRELFKFNLSIVLGLTTCFVINVAWCWSILNIVPQMDTCIASSVAGNQSELAEFDHVTESTPHVIETDPFQKQSLDEHCDGPSLERAHTNGQISTIPLNQVIENDYPQYNVLSIFVQYFIMISITVSYLSFGSALHHLLSGIVESFWSSKGSTVSKLIWPEESPERSEKIVWSLKTICSLFGFLVVFVIAAANPRGFIKVLDRVVSLLQNAQNGIFLSWMMISVKTCDKYTSVSLPMKLSNFWYIGYIFVAVFYLVAVIYDLYLWVKPYML